MPTKKTEQADRRSFLKTSALGAAAASLTMTGKLHAAGSDEIRVGVVGCGGRGSGATRDALDADPGVRIVAMADVFEDRLKANLEAASKGSGDRVNVPADHQFIGFDAYLKMLELDLSYVIFATPPYFRPDHVLAAVKAGKNVFFEKPVAVDPPGVRKILEAADISTQKKLTMVTGTQRHHEAPYLECIQRIRDGAIGDIVGGRVYWNQGELWHKDKSEGWKDMEWMIRDWVNWRWLSGDHIVEQHIHNIDVANWFKDAHPVKAVGSGGRARRPTGDQYDYFAVDYEYADGTHVASYCRQVNGCANSVDEFMIGTKGHTHTTSGRAEIFGANQWKYRRSRDTGFVSPYVQEHMDLIAAIRKGEPINETKRIAESTLTAIMGREAAYTGDTIVWDKILKSDMKLGPESMGWDVACPEINIPVQGTA